MGALRGSPRVASLFFLLRHATTGYGGRNILILLFWTVGGGFMACKGGVSRWVSSEGLNRGEWSWRGRHKEKRSAEHVGCDHTSTKAPDPIRAPKLSVLGRE